MGVIHGAGPIPGRMGSAGGGGEAREASPGVDHALEFRRVAPDLEGALAALFGALKAGGDERFFHPHPLDRAEARRVCQHRGQDLYYAAARGREILAYGMLRGWDEGYAIPSLGIAVDGRCRGRGVARAFVHFLHAAARLRGAPSVRLKVYEANTPARRLCEGLGYHFEPLPHGELLGLLELGR